jgi:hypothetical protein
MTLLRSAATAVAVPAFAASALAQFPPGPAANVPINGSLGGFAPGPAPFSAPAPITPGPIGIAPSPLPPGPTTTLGSFLGLSPAQREFRQRAIADTPFGQLRERVQNPLSRLTGGLIKPFPPQAPALAELLDPGPIGAAAKVKFDRLQAKQRIEAVRYLGTVDCAYWPEAEDALVGALRVDKNEWVRLAAAQTLLSGCCCTKKVIVALGIAATCSDEDGNPKEKSPRVVAAAQAALSKCLAAVCANPFVTDSPAEPEKDKGKENEREGAAMPKPGPYGEEKGAAGLSPEEVARPTGNEFYARVVRVSWAEVVGFGKHKMSVAPPVPVEYVNAAPLEREPVGDERADRPANLMDILFADAPAEKAPPMAQMSPTRVMNPKPAAAPAVAVAKSAPVAAPTVAKPTPAPATPAVKPAPVTPAASQTMAPIVPAVPQPMPTRPAAVAPVSEPARVVPYTPAPVPPAPMPAAEPAPAMKMTLVPTPPPVPAKMPTVRTAGTPSAGAVSLLNTKADPQITEAAVRALTADEIVAPATCTTLLKAAQTHTDVGVRTACIRALARGKAYNPLVLTGLEQLVDDRSVNVRVEAAVALSELKSGK